MIIILIFSVVIHEVSHGVVANHLGDPTARLSGRLTLNPIPHLDPIGSILVPGLLVLFSQLSGGGGFIIGWAKPVPVNTFNLRNQRWGPALVSLAGPASNLAVAFVFGMLLRFAPPGILTPQLFLALSSVAYLNLLLAVFNLLPIPPLDGSHLFLALAPRSVAAAIQPVMAQYGLLILLLFLFFLLPWLSSAVNLLFSLLVGTP